MSKETFLPILRELARCYQAFENYSAKHIRTLGLTPAQFDLIVTLGNTQGMSFKELGDKTLITKGTLTGVVDRLVAKKLVQRIASPTDGRSQTVQLTTDGQSLFTRIFPAHVACQGCPGRTRSKRIATGGEHVEASPRRLRESRGSETLRHKFSSQAIQSTIRFFNQGEHHGQESGLQERGQEGTRQDNQGKKGCEESKDGRKEAPMMG